MRQGPHRERVSVKISVKRRHHLSGRRLIPISLALGAAATAAACSSSTSSLAPAAATSSAPAPATSSAPASATSSAPASAPSSSAPASASAAGVTISAKSVPGVGTVLVNGQGQTLYLLTSEKGGKITCTATNGCLQVWPETALASGSTAAKAGSGVQPSLLGTVKGASGNLEVTYNHWPLYTFSGDSGPGVAHGQGLVSFGGTWYVLSAAGNPVTTSTSPGGSSPSSGGGNGY
jgi:predicted lipoprotein with Yx(FWY)xxD motif